MDDMLSAFSDDRLISELEKGHYWYSGGNFYSNWDSRMGERPTSVENAVYHRFYS